MTSTMRTIRGRSLPAAIAGVLVAMALPAGVSAGKPEAVGLFTSVHGSVSVTHPAAKAAPAVVQSDVLFKDIIETDRASRTKALFRDDSLLTMGENTRVEVRETIYDPNHNKRSTVLKLAKGKLRALVGRMFVGSGSRFEIHTTNAVAAARGTYFVVWNAKTRESGIANIGNHGDVAFTSGGKTVIVPPGQYSIAVDKLPPTSPALISAAMPSEVSSAIQGTEVKDTLLVETPTQVLQALRGTVGTGSNSGGGSAGPASGLVGGASGKLAGTVSGTVTKVTDTLNNITNKLNPVLSSSGQLHATLIEPTAEAAFRTTSPLMETFSSSGPSIAERLRAIESTVSILPSVAEAVAPVIPPVAIPAAAVELRSLIEPVTAVEPKTLVAPASTAAAAVIAVVAPTAVSSTIVEPVSTTVSDAVSTVAEPVTTVTEPVTSLTEPIATVTEPVTTVSEPVTTITEPVTTVTEPITTVTEPITVVSEPLKLK